MDTQGDAFFVAFGRAGDAVAAARERQEALGDGPIRVRIGLHTGEPLRRRTRGTSAWTSTARARIAAAGHGGQVLRLGVDRASCSTSACATWASTGSRTSAAPERLFQLGDGDFPPLTSLNRTNLPIQPTPFLGRERELAEVIGLLARARDPAR